jgi:hypothetical protein
MNELDEIWTQAMQQAMDKARAAGRADVAEYLALKAGNDQLRATGCRWLFESFIELSDDANRQGIRLEVENLHPHRFAVGHSTMVGSLLRFRHGLRSITVEAGWTRTPQDGFIRGGGLACARIAHFGMSKANAELLLIRSPENVPQWFTIAPEGRRSQISTNNLREHFKTFLGAT